MSPGALGMSTHGLAARYCSICYYPQLDGLNGNDSPFLRSYELGAIKHLNLDENWQCAPS